MKKLILAALSILFITSCAVVRYTETKYIFDFRQYIEQGFKITPAQTLNETHDCLALITIEARAGRVKISSSNGVEIISGEGYIDSSRNEHKEPNVDQMLSGLVRYAKSIGANGIIDLQFSQYSIGGGKYAIAQNVVTISGCAVNIKISE